MRHELVRLMRSEVLFVLKVAGVFLAEHSLYLGNHRGDSQGTLAPSISDLFNRFVTENI